MMAVLMKETVHHPHPRMQATNQTRTWETLQMKKVLMKKWFAWLKQSSLELCFIIITSSLIWHSSTNHG